MNQDLMDALVLIGEKDINILRLQRQVAELQSQLAKYEEKKEEQNPTD